MVVGAICREFVTNLRASNDSTPVIKLNPPYDLMMDLDKVSFGRGDRISALRALSVAPCSKQASARDATPRTLRPRYFALQNLHRRTKIRASNQIKSPANAGLFIWSGRQDLNLRPHGPKPRALPNCATPRKAQQR